MCPLRIFANDRVDPKTNLRRYMDLPKFLDLLHSRELYFRRADGFSDRLEGALFPSLRKGMNEYFETPQYADEFYKRSRMGNHVSCWTIGREDNIALWQSFGGIKTTLAVSVTLNSLLGAISKFDRCKFICKIKYIDHLRIKNFVISEHYDVIQFKHKAYRYEKELRVILPYQSCEWEESPDFLRVPINDVNQLIKSIIVAPAATDEYFESIKDICARYDLRVPVRRSGLASIPV